jgi:Domain of unknown function (DUF4351)
MLRLLSRRVGSLNSMIEEQIQALSLAQLEALGGGLLEFTNVADLQDWLQNHT